MPHATSCPRCGTALAAAGLGGFCPQCVAPVAFGPEPQFRLADIPLNWPSSFGEFELLEEIARGGMGVIFKARQVSLKRIVALKMIRAGSLATPLQLRRFRAEAEAAARLQHPNIVAIHEVGERDGLPYFSMDYVEGRNLSELCAAGPLPSQRAARYLKVIAHAIHYAHQHGILHRDLKPSNVLIDRFDQPRITDFGLAKRLADGSETETQLTVTGEFLGTPAFAPPEQASAKAGAIGPYTDVYSLGAILYFLVTGRPPVQGKTVGETLSAALNQPPIRPRVLNPGVPRDLETICLKCLEKEPQRRYASALELAGDLERFLIGQPIRARPVGRPERAWRWCRRRPAIASLTLGLVLSLAGLVTALGYLRAKRQGPAEGTPAPQPAARRSFDYTNPVPVLIALDEDTLSQTVFGPGLTIAIDPKNNHLWCPILRSHAVLIRDGVSGAVLTNLTFADCPGGAVFDDRRRVAWVSAQCGMGDRLVGNTNYPSNDYLWVINADTYSVIGGPISSGGVNGGPELLNPVTGRYYHCCITEDPRARHCQRIDNRLFLPKDTGFVGPVFAVNPRLNLLYAGASNILQIIDGAPDPEQLRTNINLPGLLRAACVDTNRDRLFVACDPPPRILVLDPRTGQTLDSIIPDGGVPGLTRIWGLAIDPHRNSLFALASVDSAGKTSYLIAIDGHRQIPVPLPGRNPGGPVVNPAINKLYVWVDISETSPGH